MSVCLSTWTYKSQSKHSLRRCRLSNIQTRTTTDSNKRAFPLKQFNLLSVYFTVGLALLIAAHTYNASAENASPPSPPAAISSSDNPKAKSNAVASKKIEKTPVPIVPAKTYSGDLSEQLMASLLDRHTLAKLYEQANNPWPGGNYQLEVFKNGQPEVRTNAQDILIKMPLRIAIAGDIANALLKFKMACKASFTTLGEVRLQPVKPGRVNALASSVTLPIPQVMADCDGSPVPIDGYLKNLLEQNKRRWELELDAKVNAWLSE
jgi:hypothetical protein